MTIYSAQRAQTFSDRSLAEKVIHILKEDAAVTAFLLHAWCLMPDHLHILMEGAHEQADLFRFVRRFKWHTAALHLRDGGSRLWQRNFYKHLLRNREDVGCIAAYIWMNPVRKRLCEIPGEYPHSGSMTMPWRKIVPGDAWLPPWKNASGR